MPSEGEVSHFSRVKNHSEKDVVKELLNNGINHVVIKRASKGASHYRLLDGNIRERHVQGLPTSMIDPTGAGDCFGATFVSLLLAGYPEEKALEYANASGALAVSSRGPMEGLSSLNQIEKLLFSLK
ncbi:TPA: sugar kinase, partial [Escherichia coli]|nr:sugar kinase [Escherichia coli]